LLFTFDTNNIIKNICDATYCSSTFHLCVIIYIYIYINNFFLKKPINVFCTTNTSTSKQLLVLYCITANSKTTITHASENHASHHERMIQRI
jgi:hypothetical protein